MALFDSTQGYDPATGGGLAALGSSLLQSSAPHYGPPTPWQTVLGNALNAGNAGYRQGMDKTALQNAMQAQTPIDLMAALKNIQDPDIQKAVLANRLSAMTPKFEVTKDAAGNPIAYNSLNPTQSMRIGGNPADAINNYQSSTNIQPNPQPTNNSVISPKVDAMLQPNQQTPQSGTTQPATSTPAQPAVNSDFLAYAKQQAPVAAGMAESMINGTFKQEAGKGENDPNYVLALQIAQKADPTFGPQSLIGRPKMVDNSTSGDMYKQETNLNTSMAHLYDLHQLAPLVNNSPNSSQPLNGMIQLGQKYVGGPSINGVNRYKSSLVTAAPEIAKYLGGGAATDTSTEEAQSSYDPTLPTATIQGNALDLGSKMMAKAGSLQHEYDSAMGAAGSHKVANPTTLALFADMQGKPLTAEQQQLVNQHRAESNLEPKTWTNPSQSSQPLAQIKVGTKDYGNAVLQAKRAIAQGKDPAAVANRLQQYGIDPKQAGL